MKTIKNFNETTPPRLPDEYQEVEYIESWSDWHTENVQFSLPYDWWDSYDMEIDFSNVWSAEWVILNITQSL